MEFGNVYATGALDPQGLVQRAVDDGLGEEKFDTMIGMGLSGALVIPALAQALGCYWAIVRKPADGTHSSWKIEGNIGEEWLFVDDLISSGRTLKYVRDVVANQCRQYEHTTRFAGAWLYNREGEFFTTDWIDRNYRRSIPHTGRQPAEVEARVLAYSDLAPF